jgi:hypothetical protein
MSLADVLEFEKMTDPPPLTPLDQALAYLQHEGRRAKRCANQYCVSPYFFTRSRMTEKYCGNDACAADAKRAAKLKWWHDPKNLAKRKHKSQRKRKEKPK